MGVFVCCLFPVIVLNPVFLFQPKAVVRSRTILKIHPIPAAATAPPSPHAPLSPEITVLNALINHSEEYFLPALDNIRAVSPIIEETVARHVPGSQQRHPTVTQKPTA